MERYSLGLDIGSISVNTVVLDEHRNIVESHYTFCHGTPFTALLGVLRDVLSRFPSGSFARVATTGTGGQLAARFWAAISSTRSWPNPARWRRSIRKPGR